MGNSQLPTIQNLVVLVLFVRFQAMPSHFHFAWVNQKFLILQDPYLKHAVVALLHLYWVMYAWNYLLFLRPGDHLYGGPVLHTSVSSCPST
uniref:Uncharacterized protein n=1 Tax=Panstrongylus lignarius TaxID=156445 RepID=A0A224Y3U6_9HEMI